MANANLPVCLKEVFRLEGGYVDNANDSGGATNMGISRKTLARWRGVSPWWKMPKPAVRNLTRTQAAAIYRALYWTPIGGNALPAGLDLAMFDFAVHSGPVRAVKCLQAELKVRRDGVMGPITLGAMRARAAADGVAGLIHSLDRRRLAFLQRLSSFSTFARGWTNRVAEIERIALHLAGAEAHSLPKPRRTLMNLLAGYKTYIMGALMLLAGLGQVFGFDIPGFDGQTAGQLIVQGLAIVFLRKGLKSDIGNA